MKCIDCDLRHTCCDDSDKGECKTIFKEVKNSDNVNHPSHYNQGGIETIEVIKSSTVKGFEGYLVCNIIKYVSRYKHKNGLEDILKSKWYLNRLIKELEGEK